MGSHASLTTRLVRGLLISGPDDCWPWTKAKNRNGYGIMKEGLTHRIAYTIFVGSIPSGEEIDHECHNEAVWRGECDGGPNCPHRLCCNPAHLESGSHIKNMRGGVTGWSKKETCKHGHSTAKYRRQAPTQSYCAKCRTDGNRRRYEQRKTDAE